jgi:acyl-CoA dehydrogenase
MPSPTQSFDDAVFLEAAAAKIRCAEAAEKGAAIAHQVHGAIGFTIEHILHRYTLRALAWRDDFGSESYWAVELGKLVARAAPTNCGRWWPRAEQRFAFCTRVNMTAALRFDPIRLPPECEAAAQGSARLPRRRNRRRHLRSAQAQPRGHRRAGIFPRVGARLARHDLAEEIWRPRALFLERYVVTEEMRVANAPVRRFFVADRQSGPVLLKYAPEHIKMDILPRICRGEVCFAIGMSEPNSGSDLFAAKTKATKTDGGWLINGTKIWTSSAHIADYMIAIFRTSPPTKENRRHGLTQFLVDMKTPGIKVNPIGQITGQHEFNEVVFTDAFMPDDHVLGEIDGAWKQATSELAYERSGPERFLETYYVLTELVRAVGPKPDTRSAEGHRPAGGAAAHHAADVGLGRRHAAGRQGAGGRSLDRQGHRHGVGAASCRTGCATSRPSSTPTPPTARRWKSSCLRDQDRAQADHPGRHHRSAARHHRARLAGPALNSIEETS